MAVRGCCFFKRDLGIVQSWGWVEVRALSLLSLPKSSPKSSKPSRWATPVSPQNEFGRDPNAVEVGDGRIEKKTVTPTERIRNGFLASSRMVVSPLHHIFPSAHHVVCSGNTFRDIGVVGVVVRSVPASCHIGDYPLLENEPSAVHHRLVCILCEIVRHLKGSIQKGLNCSPESVLSSQPIWLGRFIL